MDALRHADQVLAAVWRQHPEFAVPGHVGSPMDDQATITIPRAVIEAIESVLMDQEMQRAADGTAPADTLTDSA